MAKLILPAVEYRLEGRRLSLVVPGIYESSLAVLDGQAKRKKVTQWRSEFSLPFRAKSTGPRSQLNHIWGHCEDIVEQFAEKGINYSKREIEQSMLRMSVPEGFPTHLSIDGVETPMDLAFASMDDANVVINVIHRFADVHGFWLTEYLRDGSTVRVVGGVKEALAV